MTRACACARCGKVRGSQTLLAARGKHVLCMPGRAKRQSVLTLMVQTCALTCPTPIVNLKGLLREYEESNSWRDCFHP